MPIDDHSRTSIEAERDDVVIRGGGSLTVNMPFSAVSRPGSGVRRSCAGPERTGDWR